MSIDRLEREPSFPPDGVRVVELATHADERGTFTELFRSEWEVGVEPIQWNAVASRPGVLRGVHVHVRHADYLTVVRGRATVGLRDLRRGSASEGSAGIVELRGDRMSALTIPPGVAHGFLFHDESLHVYAVTHYWDTDDELGCRWDDPALEIPWPQAPTSISERDGSAQPLAGLMQELEPHQGALGGRSRAPGPAR